MREIEAAIRQRVSGTGYRRALSAPRARSFIASYALDRIAAWMASVAVVTLSYRLTEDVGVVALFVLAQVLVRLFIGSMGANVLPRGRWSLAVANIVRLVAVGSLVFVWSSDDLGWALVATGLMCGASGIIEGSQSRLVPVVAARNGLPVFNRLIGRVEQASAAVGPALAGILLFSTDEGATFALSALFFAGSMVVLQRSHWLVGNDLQTVPDQPTAPADISLARFRHPVLRIVAAGLVAVAALGAVIRVTLIDVVVAQLEYASGHYGLLLALVGLGALAGPLPVHKLLGRIGIGYVVTGSVVMLAFGMAILGFANHVAIIIPILLASGVLIVTCDLVAAVTLRRLVPGDDLAGTARATIAIVVGGQLLGLIAVLGLSQLWSSGIVVTLVAVGWIIALVVVFVSGKGPRLALATIVPSTYHDAPEDRDVT